MGNNYEFESRIVIPILGWVAGFASSFCIQWIFAASKRKSDAIAALSSIGVELEVNWKHYTNMFSPKVVNQPNGFIEASYVPPRFNPFVVYEANSGKLGDIKNDAVRIKIVAAMSLARRLISVWEYYGIQYDKYSQSILSGDKLVFYSAEVQRLHDAAMKEIPETLQMIQDEIRHVRVKSELHCWYCDK